METAGWTPVRPMVSIDSSAEAPRQRRAVAADVDSPGGGRSPRVPAGAAGTSASGRHHSNDDATDNGDVMVDFADSRERPAPDDVARDKSTFESKIQPHRNRASDNTPIVAYGRRLRDRPESTRSQPSWPEGTIGGWVPEENLGRDHRAAQISSSPDSERIPLSDWVSGEEPDLDADWHDPPAAGPHQGRQGVGKHVGEPLAVGQEEPQWIDKPSRPSNSADQRRGRDLSEQDPIGRQDPSSGRDRRAPALTQQDPIARAVAAAARDAATDIQGRFDAANDDDDNDGDASAEESGSLAESSAPQPATRARRIGRHWGRYAELWVPESLREARVDPGRRGALILLLIATLAATVTAVGVWRDRPESRPVETSAITGLAVASTRSSPENADPSQSTTPGATSTVLQQESAAQPTAQLVVSVTGLVAHPGLVTLPAGARVADALTAAGGASSDADLTGINLAARLSDGDSVVVGSSNGAPGVTSEVASSGQGPNLSATAGAGGAAGAEIINLNTADEAGLDTLPGVGPVMAQNILAWRETNGSFTNIEQLQEISGIGPSRYAQIAPLVTVS